MKQNSYYKFVDSIFSFFLFFFGLKSNGLFAFEFLIVPIWIFPEYILKHILCWTLPLSLNCCVYFASLDKTLKYETPSLSNDKDKFALHTHNL